MEKHVQALVTNCNQFQLWTSKSKHIPEHNTLQRGEIHQEEKKKKTEYIYVVILQLNQQHPKSYLLDVVLSETVLMALCTVHSSD